VPVLWEKATGTIVNNESADIVRMFNGGFGAPADAAVDLYPAALRSEIDAWNARIYPGLNNGGYRHGRQGHLKDGSFHDALFWIGTGNFAVRVNIPRQSRGL